MIQNKLFEFISCPTCKLDLDKDLNCQQCNISFKTVNQVPIFVINDDKQDEEEGIEIRRKKYQIDFYSKVNDYLSNMQKMVGNEVAFAYLNFGYKENENRQYASIELPKFYLNKNSVKLTIEVIGDVDISGKKILEVGCGRGGNIITMNEFYDPELLVGVDITEQSIRYVTENQNIDNSYFMVGDAENLPIKSNYFDVVFNLESSHAYPSRNKFYHEVYRVLKQGGIFMYSDLMTHEDFMIGQDYLSNLGFEILREQDITSNVLLSCDESSKVKGGAFNSINDQDHLKLLGDFVASPGSDVYESMNSGEKTYKILIWEKKCT